MEEFGSIGEVREDWERFEKREDKRESMTRGDEQGEH